MSRNEYIHIDDWRLVDVSPSGALKVENDYSPFLPDSYDPNPKYKCEWLPPTHAEIREDDELWVKEWLAESRGMI